MTNKDALKAIMNEGRTLHSKGRHAEEYDAFARAVRFAETFWDANDFEVFWPVLSLAMAAGEPEGGGHGRIAEVLELEQRALRIVQVQFGETNPWTSYVLEKTGFVFWQLGRHEEARERLERATELFSRANGDVKSTAYLLTMLGSLLVTMNLPAEALPYCERALRIEEALEQDSSRVMFGAFWVGRCLLGVGRMEEAAIQFERALAIRIARRPPEFKGEDSRSKEFREWIAEARAKP